MSIVWDGLVSVLIDAINAVIVGLAAILSPLVSALPGMPSLPTPPSQVTEVEGWVAWVFPVGPMVDALVFAQSMVLLWWIISIALRWAKVQRGNA
jgi:hypothetical protein